MSNTHRVSTTRLAFCFAAAALAGSAGCSRATRAPVDATPQVAVADSAGADRVRADSVVRADSIALARADSLRAVVADSLRADSVRAAQDSARRQPVTPRPAPPARECVFDLSASPPESRATFFTYPDSSTVTYIGGGFVGSCQGDNNTIRADSAEYLETAGVLNLYGNVVYTEPGRLNFTAMRANYFTNEERLYAEGNVVATQLTSNSTFTGQTMEYYRARPGIREQSRLYAPGRPTVRLTERDSLRTPPPPVVITANVMEDLGDSLLYAWGAVTIDRGEIHATSDSSSYDKAASEARLIRNATVVSRDASQPFRLAGDTIQMFNEERTLERVVAIHNATAVNDDLQLAAERLDLRLVEQRLERAFAYGEGRARATTPEQELEADSLAIYMNERRVREVHAIGGAIAMGIPDTTKIRSIDRDMLRGDSVYARFDTLVVPGDTSSQARIREIESIGNASSLFQVASRRGPLFPPALNYARGGTILISFDEGVRNVRVDSNASGVYLEPIPDSLVDTTAIPPQSDSARRAGPVDTLRRVPPDTLRQGPPRRPPPPRVPPSPPLMLPFPQSSSRHE